MASRENILTELLAIAPKLAQIQAGHPYKVPENYFERLEVTIIQRVRALEAPDPASELEILSPLLGGLNKKMPFSSPPGYFDTLEKSIVTGDKKAPGKVMAMSAPGRIFRFAAAAVIVGLIATALLLYVNQPPVNPHSSLAVVDSTGQNELFGKVDQYSDEELAAFVDDYATLPVNQGLAAEGEIEGEDIRLILAEVSDQELEAYQENYN